MTHASSPESTSTQDWPKRGEADPVLGNLNETLASLQGGVTTMTGPIVVSKLVTLQNMNLSDEMVAERARVFREIENHRVHLRDEEADRLLEEWNEILRADETRAAAVNSLRRAVQPQFIPVIDQVLEEAGEMPAHVDSEETVAA